MLFHDDSLTVLYLQSVDVSVHVTSDEKVCILVMLLNFTLRKMVRR